MPREDVEPDSSSDSDDAELMKARTGDYSETEESNTLVRRRKRKVRGRGSVRARRERSLTPDARGTQQKEIVAPKKAAPDPEEEEEEEEQQEVIKILPSEALGEDEGWGDKENIPQNSQPEKQITKSQSESIVDDTNEENVEKASELTEDAEIEEDEEEEEELLNPRDPRYVPKNITFYMHDTKRMAISDDNTAFKSDQQAQQEDDGNYVLGDAFEPTKDGKWGHDMFDKICDRTQRHTREDHWGKSYGFRQQNFQNFRPGRGSRGGRNSNRVCLDWQQGRCNYGNTCRFLHSDDSRQQNQDRDQWNGSDRNPGVCYDWQKGLCNRGNRCRFSHNGNSGGAPGVCYDWQEGLCHRGDRCRFPHDDYNGGRNRGGSGGRRSDICYDYQRGQCFREYCRFSHEDSGYGGGYSRSQHKGKAHEDYNNKEGDHPSKDYLEEKTTTGGRPAGGPRTGTRRDEHDEDDGWDDNDSSVNKTEDEEVKPSKKGVDDSASPKNKTQLSEDKPDKTLEISKSKESNTELSGFGNDTRNWDEYSSCDDGNFN